MSCEYSCQSRSTTGPGSSARGSRRGPVSTSRVCRTGPRAAQEAARSADIQRVASQPLILVADDDDDLRLLVSLRLERVGYSVVSARDGQEALELAQVHQPDLLLLDVSMPIMGGHDLCRAIAASQASPPPVIFLSAHGSPEDKVRGFDAGAVDYIAKPFNTTELTARVAAALRTSTRMASLERDATIDHLTGV